MKLHQVSSASALVQQAQHSFLQREDLLYLLPSVQQHVPHQVRDGLALKITCQVLYNLDIVLWTLDISCASFSKTVCNSQLVPA